jgi:hypothetical protein
MGRYRSLEHDPEKWIPVSRLREAQAPACRFVRCFGGRRQVGKDHAQTMKLKGNNNSDSNHFVLGAALAPQSIVIIYHS